MATHTLEATTYEGYEILAKPLQSAESGDWQVNIDILIRRGSAIKGRHFSTRAAFPTRQEAVEHCLNFGMKIIDGQVQNSSIADL